jgi:hypothetical protein
MEYDMSQPLKVGHRVNWNTPQGIATGRIIRTISRRTELNGHTVAASKGHARYEVESEQSGKRAVHRAPALHKTQKH